MCRFLAAGSDYRAQGDWLLAAVDALIAGLVNPVNCAARAARSTLVQGIVGPGGLGRSAPPRPPGRLQSLRAGTAHPDPRAP